MKKTKPSVGKAIGKGHFPVPRSVLNGGYSKKSWAFIDMQNLASFNTRWSHNVHGEQVCIHRGEMLACQTALAKRWDTTRMTVHRWLKEWQKDGLLTIRHTKTKKNPANVVTKMTYYDTGGVPLEKDNDDVTPSTPLKVASTNDLQKPEKKDVTGVSENVTGGCDENVTGGDDDKSMYDNDLHGPCPF